MARGHRARRFGGSRRPVAALVAAALALAGLAACSADATGGPADAGVSGPAAVADGGAAPTPSVDAATSPAAGRDAAVPDAAATARSDASVPDAAASMTDASTPAANPVSECVAFDDDPFVSCSGICAAQGKGCAAECYLDQVLPAEVAYYLDAESCAADHPYAFGATLACDESLGSSLLAGIVTYARCCCSGEPPSGPVQCSAAQSADLPDDMVCVPVGVFEMGANLTWQGPVRQVALSTYFIDRDHVTVEAYQACVDAGSCTPAATEAGCNAGVAGREQHPINCVDWNQAAAYCAWRDKRLPTEAEWEKAARGTDARTFPWGEETPSCARAVMDDGSGAGCGSGGTEPVGSKSPAGDSPYGATDMAGNVWDWTADWYDDAYDPTDLTDPQGPATGLRDTKVQRGGDYLSSALPFLRSTYRVEDPVDSRSTYYGFRCARTP